jgi:penicillin-insensitive murein DD-endopeptidase
MIRSAVLAAILLASTAVLPPLAQASAEAQALAATTPGMSDDQLKKLPAKKVFGGQKEPTTSMKARAIGSYAKGCMAGGKALEVDGPAWQVMRLSRNRNWGHPDMVALVERLAIEAKEKDGWNGLLVGDLAQPRGGPMLSGHASHQIGLDADVWLTPMPDRKLSPKEREEIKGQLVVKDRKRIDPDVWTEKHARLIKRAASYPQVARIFVHPPIKAELCKWAKNDKDKAWLAKVRPYFGHNWHFHIRINCPADSPNCKNQPEARPEDGTGCGNELAYWLGDKPWPQPPKADAKPQKPAKPAPPLTVSALPAECRAVVTAE